MSSKSRWIAIFFVTVLTSCLPMDIPSSIPRACVGEHRHYPFCNTSLRVSDRVNDLLSRLSLLDKTAMLTARASPQGAVLALGIPEYNWGTNCVHGVQSTCGTHCATSFPNPVNLGAVFDADAVKRMARVIGWELRALWLEGARENYESGPHVGLDCWSPNININRDPRWGRNLETPSEDPVVNARYGVAYTRGLQEGPDKRYLQAIVTLKHWIAYSFEHYGGVDRTEFDAVVSKYDFADTYYPAFRASVLEGKAKGIMCSYNRLNGVPTCANTFLNSVLRDNLKFDGYVSSDTGAVEAIAASHHFAADECAASLIAIGNGTDVCSGDAYRHCFEKLVASHVLDVKYIDNALRNTLALRFKLGLFDPVEDQPYWHVAPSEVNKPEHRQLSLDITRKSIVLLQNLHNTLPLNKGTTIAVIGPHISARRGMMGNYYGQICHGDHKELGCVQTPLKAIQKANGAEFTFAATGCGVNDTSTAGYALAIQAAKRAEVVVMFLGIDTTIEYEPNDRVDIGLPKTQLRILKEIRAIGKPIVVVLFNGGMLAVDDVVDHADAILEAFYPGFYGACAISDILFGDVNPSGKLPVTMYTSKYVDEVKMESMDMSQPPGRSYRYYKGKPTFPFGWGLSYTNFTLEMATYRNGSAVTHLDHHPARISIAVRVSNTGSRAGDEVVFCFVRPVKVNITGPAHRLNRQILDYQRLSLAPHTSTLHTFLIRSDQLALVTARGHRIVFPGVYEILVTNGAHAHASILVDVRGKPQLVHRFPTSPPGFFTV